MKATPEFSGSPQPHAASSTEPLEELPHLSGKPLMRPFGHPPKPSLTMRATCRAHGPRRKDLINQLKALRHALRGVKPEGTR